MDIKIIITIAVLALVIIISGISLYRSAKTKKPSVDTNSILGLFDKSSIIKIDFVRNKLVVSFKDINVLDVQKLKENGAQGINIIGDKIKFFISDDEEVNKKLYNELVDYIER